MRFVIISTVALLIRTTESLSPGTVAFVMTSKQRRNLDSCAVWFVNHIERSLTDMKTLRANLETPRDRPENCKSQHPHPAVYFSAEEANRIALETRRIAAQTTAQTTDPDRYKVIIGVVGAQLKAYLPQKNHRCCSNARDRVSATGNRLQQILRTPVAC